MKYCLVIFVFEKNKKIGQHADRDVLVVFETMCVYKFIVVGTQSPAQSVAEINCVIKSVESMRI